MRTICIGALLALAPISLNAQAPSTQVASAEALGKARELMTVMNTSDLVIKSLDAQAGIMTKGLAERLLQGGLAPSEMANDPEFRAIVQRYLDRIEAEMRASTKALVPQIVEQTTLLYARNFSAAQLGDMVAFYRSPTGQAYLAKVPELSAQAATISRDLTQGPAIEVIKNMMPQLVTEVTAWADKHPPVKGSKK